MTKQVKKIGTIYTWLPYFSLICFLTLIYIGNVHRAEKKIRRINETHKEMEELRRQYITIKQRSMYDGTLYQVGKKVRGLDLSESVKIPNKIEP